MRAAPHRLPVQNGIRISKSCEPQARLLHVGDLALAAIGKPRFGHLGEIDGVVLGDVLGAHHAGDLQVAHFGVHLHLLMPADDEIAVGQDLRHQGGEREVDRFRTVDRAGAGIGGRRSHIDELGRIGTGGSREIVFQTEEIGQVRRHRVVARARRRVGDLRSVGDRDVDRDDVADMAGARIGEEAVRAGVPERIGLTRRGRRGGHRQLHLALLRIGDRRELRRCADILDAIDRAAARQRRDQGDRADGGFPTHLTHDVLFFPDHGFDASWGSSDRRRIAGANFAGPGHDGRRPGGTRRDSALSTVSPMPPSLTARPVAVSEIPGRLKVMVTVSPLLTRTGMRTSSARTGSPARSSRRASRAGQSLFGHGDAGTHAIGRHRRGDEIARHDDFAPLDIVGRNRNARARRLLIGRGAAGSGEREGQTQARIVFISLVPYWRSAAACRWRP